MKLNLLDEMGINDIFLSMHPSVYQSSVIYIGKTTRTVIFKSHSLTN